MRLYFAVMETSLDKSLNKKLSFLQKTSYLLDKTIIHICVIISKIFRSSRSQVFFKIVVLKNFAIFTRNRKTTVLESPFTKVVDLQACNFIKRRLQRRCFPVNIAKCLRTPFLQNTFFGYF